MLPGTTVLHSLPPPHPLPRYDMAITSPGATRCHLPLRVTTFNRSQPPHRIPTPLQCFRSRSHCRRLWTVARAAGARRSAAAGSWVRRERSEWERVQGGARRRAHRPGPLLPPCEAPADEGWLYAARDDGLVEWSERGGGWCLGSYFDAVARLGEGATEGTAGRRAGR